MLFVWNYIWENNPRKNFMAIFTAVILSSILFYSVDWYWFYNTRATDKRLEAETQFNALKTMLILAEGNNKQQVQVISDYLSNLNANITLTKKFNSKIIWKINNNKYLDKTKTIISLNQIYTNNELVYEYEYEYANRPPFMMALYRAWTWSAYDLIKDFKAWNKYQLYHRSTPLYSCFIIIYTIIQLLFNRIYREKIEYKQIKAYLEEFEEKKNNALVLLQDKTNNIMKELTEKDRLIGQLRKNIEDVRCRHSNDIITAEDMMQNMHNKIVCLEEDIDILLLEKEHIEKERDKIIDEYNELEKKLVTNISIAESAKSIASVDAMLNNIDNQDVADRTKVVRDSRTFDKIRKQLKKWVKTNDWARTNISSHGTSGIISKYVEKIDSDFINEFFVHVRNEEYSSREAGTIKVVVNNGDKKSYDGNLYVYLNNDMGCSIALAYNTKANAPVKNIGFVLAIMLRAVCREFEDYKIKAQ